MNLSRDESLAVVTGAAGGLGASFADKLAARGHRLLLVDQRSEPLERVCTAIEQEHGVEAEPCVVDLCDRVEVQHFADRLRQTVGLALLINNAGFGTLDYFVDTETDRVLDMIDLHVAAPMTLCRAVLPGMLARDRGAIINVSSLSAWLPSAGNVSYGSTKCSLTFFSTALADELRGTNVRIQALCPGFVRTEFHDTDGMRAFSLQNAASARFWMSPDTVADCSLRKLATKQVIVVPGVAYRVLGRLAQMPVFRPITQWLTRTPRRIVDKGKQSASEASLVSAEASESS